MVVVKIEKSLIFTVREKGHLHRLTTIKDIFLSNIEASNVEFISRVLGQGQLPVENVVLKNIDVYRARQQAHSREHEQLDL